MSRRSPDIAYGELVHELQDLGARHLPTLETLQAKQTRMLADFARAGIPRRKWRKLLVCDGQECPNRTCSGACWFGERAAFLRLVLEAYTLLSATGLPLWFVTIVDPRYRQPPGRLAEVSLGGMQQGLRRRLRRLEAAYGPVRAFGAIEASLELEADGTAYWGPHPHLIVATRAPKPALVASLRPAGGPEGGARPVVCVPVTDLLNVLGYSAKRAPAEREAFLGSRGTQDRHKRPVRAAAAVEYDRWLLEQDLTARLILRGMKRVHDRLTLLTDGG